MTGKKSKREVGNSVAQIAIYIYLCNALCKYFLPNMVTKLLPVLALCLTLLTTQNPFAIKINRIDKPFYAFLFVWLLGCIYSPAPTKGLGYVLSFALALILSSYCWKKTINERKIVLFIAVACILISAFVIIQPVMPETVDEIARKFNYALSEYADMSAWARNGWYSGLFPDRAPAAFYACVLIGTGLYFLYDSYQKSLSMFRRLGGVVLILVGAYAELLTAKRGLLVGAAVAVFMTFIVFKKANKASVWRICIGVVGSIIAIVLVFSQIEATQTMMIRFFANDNIMTGRDLIYHNIYAYISSNLIWGTGTASAFSLLGIGGHNIYLTVLMENGIIGILFFVAALLFSLYKTIRIALLMGEKNKTELPFLMFSLYIQTFFLIYGMSGNPLYDNYILYFYLFAILIVKNKDNQHRLCLRRCDQ